jgi:signal peptidase I
MQKEKNRRELLVMLRGFAFWIGSGFLLLNYVLGFWSVKNNDMAPNLQYGDLLMYSRLNTDIEQNDLIIYKQDNELYCGKVVLTPGGSVNIDEQNNLHFSSLPSCFLNEEIPAYESAIRYPQKAESNQYFVLSYDLQNGKDSRCFGLIEKNQIEGKVLLALLVFGL